IGAFPRPAGSRRNVRGRRNRWKRYPARYLIPRTVAAEGPTIAPMARFNPPKPVWIDVCCRRITDIPAQIIIAGVKSNWIIANPSSRLRVIPAVEVVLQVGGFVEG